MNSSLNKEEAGILNIESVKAKIEGIIENILKKFFENNNNYFENQTKDNPKDNRNQEFIDHICNEVIKEVYNQINGFKLICTGHLLGYGNAPFFFDSNCLWDKKTDYFVTHLYEQKEKFYVYICLFIIAP